MKTTVQQLNVYIHFNDRGSTDTRCTRTNVYTPVLVLQQTATTKQMKAFHLQQIATTTTQTLTLPHKSPFTA